VKIATWNVNGIRARQAQVLEFIAREQPDVLCLQEIKASPDQLTFDLRDIDGYWGHWHGGKGYSGVALLFATRFADPNPTIVHPPFDFEQRI
jgi:exodeoxyribonuclease III